MSMGFAPTWLPQVSPPPLLHKTTLTTDLYRHCMHTTRACALYTNSSYYRQWFDCDSTAPRPFDDLRYAVRLTVCTCYSTAA